MRHFEDEGANETLMSEEIASILLVKLLILAGWRVGRVAVTALGGSDRCKAIVSCCVQPCLAPRWHPNDGDFSGGFHMPTVTAESYTNISAQVLTTEHTMAYYLK